MPRHLLLIAFVLLATPRVHAAHDWTEDVARHKPSVVNIERSA